MPTRELLTPARRLRLDALPVDLDERLMTRHHTLSEADLAVVSRRRSATNRLGFGVQLCLLRFPGRPLRPREVAPEKIVRYVASQLGADPRLMDSYAGGTDGRPDGGAGRDTTRREHLAEIVATFGFGAFDEEAHRGLSVWLADLAAHTDSGLALVEALLEEMRRRRIVAPAISAAEALAWDARRRAREGVARAGADAPGPRAQEAQECGPHPGPRRALRGRGLRLRRGREGSHDQRSPGLRGPGQRERVGGGEAGGGLRGEPRGGRDRAGRGR